jgi:hypothetical protein
LDVSTYYLMKRFQNLSHVLRRSWMWRGSNMIQLTRIETASDGVETLAIIEANLSIVIYG